MNRWDAYDQLPPLLRAALQEAVVDWGAPHVWSRWQDHVTAIGRRAAEELTLRALDRSEQAELRRFAEAQGGYSAHLAAGATIQRYGAC